MKNNQTILSENNGLATSEANTITKARVINAAKFLIGIKRFYSDYTKNDLMDLVIALSDFNKNYTVENGKINKWKLDFINFQFSTIMNDLFREIFNRRDEFTASEIARFLFTFETFNIFKNPENHLMLDTLHHHFTLQFDGEEFVRPLDLAIFIRSFSESFIVPKESSENMNIILDAAKDELINVGFSLVQKIFCLEGLSKLKVSDAETNVKTEKLIYFLVERINEELKTKKSHILNVHKDILRNVAERVYPNYSTETIKILGNISIDYPELAKNPASLKSLSEPKRVLTKFYSDFLERKDNKKFKLRPEKYSNYSFLFMYIGGAFENLASNAEKEKFKKHISSTFLDVVKNRIQDFTKAWNHETICSFFYLLKKIKIKPADHQIITENLYSKFIKEFEDMPIFSLKDIYIIMNALHGVKVDDRLAKAFRSKTLETLATFSNNIPECMLFLGEAVDGISSTDKNSLKQQIEADAELIISKLNNLWKNSMPIKSEDLKFKSAKVILHLSENLRNKINQEFLQDLGITKTSEVLTKSFLKQSNNDLLIKVSAETALSNIHPLQRTAMQRTLQVVLNKVDPKNKEMYIELNTEILGLNKVYVSNKCNRSNCAIITT